MRNVQLGAPSVCMYEPCVRQCWSFNWSERKKLHRLFPFVLTIVCVRQSCLKISIENANEKNDDKMRQQQQHIRAMSGRELNMNAERERKITNAFELRLWWWHKTHAHRRTHKCKRTHTNGTVDVLRFIPIWWFYRGDCLKKQKHIKMCRYHCQSAFGFHWCVFFLTPCVSNSNFISSFFTFIVWFIIVGIYV